MDDVQYMIDNQDTLSNEDLQAVAPSVVNHHNSQSRDVFRVVQPHYQLSPAGNIQSATTFKTMGEIKNKAKMMGG